VIKTLVLGGDVGLEVILCDAADPVKTSFNRFITYNRFAENQSLFSKKNFYGY
jgi:hypothetical protein